MSNDHTRTITAFFGNREDADAAVVKLLALGIGKDVVAVAPASQDPEGQATIEGKGPLGLIATLFMPDEDRALYAEESFQDGYVVSVEALGSDEDAVYNILEASGATERNTA